VADPNGKLVPFETFCSVRFLVNREGANLECECGEKCSGALIIPLEPRVQIRQVEADQNPSIDTSGADSSKIGISNFAA
jgi:hypothetical protein